MGRQIELTTNERNTAQYLERQPGVTSVVISSKHGSKHAQKIGSWRVIRAEQKGVLLMTYHQGSVREFYVHAVASPERDRWVKQVMDAGKIEDFKPKESVAHVPTKAGLPSDVPAPKPLDASAGQVYAVTPELAIKWLERNTRNRELRDATVFKYASDMKAGKWKVSPDAIAFDTNGAIINGQHRLYGVMEAGVTVDMLVVFDLDPDVVYVLDDHLKRRVVDVLHIARPGTSVTNKMISIARNMMVSRQVVDRNRHLDKTSRQKSIEFLDRHMEAITFSVRECFKSKSTKWISNANIQAVVARAFYTVDHERLKQFGSVLLDGIIESHADDMAVVFRNWLMGLDEKGMRAKSSTVYNKCERALQAFVNKERKKALFEAPTELFPLPEEQSPRRRKKVETHDALLAAKV